MAPTLGDLPVEILDAIIDQLPKGHALADREFRTLIKDLKSLRQTCRQLESKTRRRFARTIYATVSMDVLKPESRMKADAALSDETFREYVRSFHVYFGPLEANAGNIMAWDLDTCWQLHRHLPTSLRKDLGESPLVKDTATSEPAIFKVTLTVILDRDASSLKTLYLGSEYHQHLSIQPFMLQGFTKASSALRQLEGLMVYSMVEEQNGQSVISPSFGNVHTTHALSDLVAMAPNLVELRVSGIGSDRNCGQWIFEVQQQSPAPPALSRLALHRMALTEKQIVTCLVCFKSTLKFLWLPEIALPMGAWKRILRLLREELNLEHFRFHTLLANDSLVSFEKIIQVMPLIIDHQRPVPAVDFEDAARSERNKYLEWDWMYALKPKALGCSGRSFEFKNRVNGVHEAIEDSWVWITLRATDFDMVDAAVGRGDDVNQWLESMEDDHELVDWLDDSSDDSSDSELSDTNDSDDMHAYAATFFDSDDSGDIDYSDLEDVEDDAADSDNPEASDE